MEPRLQQYQLGKYNENAEMQSTYGTVAILNASLASPVSSNGEPPQTGKEDAPLMV